MDVFVCNCSDCRKITASMFASNIIVKDEYVKHLRGLENLKTFSQSTTIESGKKMTNWFCHTCGTLMYRVGDRFPGVKILRLGTVDDFNLAEVRIPRVLLGNPFLIFFWFPGVCTNVQSMLLRCLIILGILLYLGIANSQIVIRQSYDQKRNSLSEIE